MGQPYGGIQGRAAQGVGVQSITWNLVHYEAVGEALSRLYGADVYVGGAIVPAIVEHREPMPMDGEAIGGHGKVLRHVVDQCELQQVTFRHFQRGHEGVINQDDGAREAVRTAVANCDGPGLLPHRSSRGGRRWG